ncbi:unnamed protein product [Rotaria sp. Silwood2]|nr:unnamed protein product [Rotaria sp. Silwood2]
MQQTDGAPTTEQIELYIPRKCAASNKIIAAKDHAAIQLDIAEIDEHTGRITGKNRTYAICGSIRMMGEADDSLLRLAARDGFTILSKSQQSELTSYLSRRRNTTGSISINKIVDLKNTSSGNTLKLSGASPFGSSSNKVSTENIFQTVEDSDLFTTRQILQINENLVNSYNEYDWCPLDIAIMLNNIPMIQLLVEYGGEESSKIQPEECRYQSVCQQLTILSQQNSDETIKKSSSNKLTADDVQLRRSSPSNDTQQRHRRISKGQQEQLQIQQQQQQQFYQQRTLTLTQMKDNYEQAGENKKKKKKRNKMRKIIEHKK